MISIDKSLLADKSLGDSIERHEKYGNFCDKLDIIVLSKGLLRPNKISEKVTVYPSNSFTRFGYFIDVYKKAKELFRKNRYDLVVSEWFSSLPAWLLKNKFKIKFLLNLHGDFFDNRKGLEGLWHNYVLLFVNSFIIKKADAIRVVSQGIRQKLIRHGVDEQKIHIISTPVNLKKFEKYNSAKVAHYKKEFPGKNILFIGRLEPIKNLSWFLQVFKKVLQKYKDVNLIIGGTGSQLEKLKAKAKKLKIDNKVKFLGRVEHDDVADFLHFCDFLVLPSISESFGKTLIEANACAKPVIATATTGAQEIIQNNKNGFLIKINNSQQMQNKILELLMNPELAEKMGKLGKKLVAERYGSNTQKIIDLWKEIIE